MPALEKAEQAVKRLRGRVDTDVEARLLVGLAIAEAIAELAASLDGMGTEAHPIYVRKV